MCYYLTWKEVFEMSAQIATILAMGFAGWMIWINAKAIRLQTEAIDLQRKATQISLFSDFGKQIFNLEEKRNEYKEKDRIIEWCIQVLMRLEYLAYLVNNDHLPFEMAEQYKGMIIEYYDNILIKEKKALAKFIKDEPEAFSELKKLYERFKQTV